MLREATEVELAYMAGFFDGEGAISPITYKKAPNGLGILVQIAQVREEALTLFKECFGGSIGVYTPTGNRLGHQKVYSYRIQGVSARKLLFALLPHLRQKQEHATLAIEILFTDLREVNGDGKSAEENHAAPIVKRKWALAVKLSKLNSRNRAGRRTKIMETYEDRYGLFASEGEENACAIEAEVQSDGR